jgi:hypothetical protein
VQLAAVAPEVKCIVLYVHKYGEEDEANNGAFFKCEAVRAKLLATYGGGDEEEDEAEEEGASLGWRETPSGPCLSALCRVTIMASYARLVVGGLERGGGGV